MRTRRTDSFKKIRDVFPIVIAPKFELSRSDSSSTSIQNLAVKIFRGRKLGRSGRIRNDYDRNKNLKGIIISMLAAWETQKKSHIRNGRVATASVLKKEHFLMCRVSKFVKTMENPSLTTEVLLSRTFRVNQGIIYVINTVRELNATPNTIHMGCHESYGELHTHLNPFELHFRKRRDSKCRCLSTISVKWKFPEGLELISTGGPFGSREMRTGNGRRMNGQVLSNTIEIIQIIDQTKAIIFLVRLWFFLGN